MTVSAEGRVENQKLNQTAALLSFGWVFDFQLDLLEKNLVCLAGFTFSLFHIGSSHEGEFVKETHYVGPFVLKVSFSLWVVNKRRVSEKTKWMGTYGLSAPFTKIILKYFEIFWILDELEEDKKIFLHKILY